MINSVRISSVKKKKEEVLYDDDGSAVGAQYSLSLRLKSPTNKGEPGNAIHQVGLTPEASDSKPKISLVIGPKRSLSCESLNRTSVTEQKNETQSVYAQEADTRGRSAYPENNSASLPRKLRSGYGRHNENTNPSPLYRSRSLPRLKSSTDIRMSTPNRSPDVRTSNQTLPRNAQVYTKVTASTPHPDYSSKSLPRNLQRVLNRTNNTSHHDPESTTARLPRSKSTTDIPSQVPTWYKNMNKEINTSIDKESQLSKLLASDMKKGVSSPSSLRNMQSATYEDAPRRLRDARSLANQPHRKSLPNIHAASFQADDNKTDNNTYVNKHRGLPKWETMISPPTDASRNKQIEHIEIPAPKNITVEYTNPPDFLELRRQELKNRELEKEREEIRRKREKERLAEEQKFLDRRTRDFLKIEEEKRRLELKEKELEQKQQLLSQQQKEHEERRLQKLKMEEERRRKLKEEEMRRIENEEMKSLRLKEEELRRKEEMLLKQERQLEELRLQKSKEEGRKRIDMEQSHLLKFREEEERKRQEVEEQRLEKLKKAEEQRLQKLKEEKEREELERRLLEQRMRHEAEERRLQELKEAEEQRLQKLKEAEEQRLQKLKEAEERRLAEEQRLQKSKEAEDQRLQKLTQAEEQRLLELKEKTEREKLELQRLLKLKEEELERKEMEEKHILKLKEEEERRKEEAAQNRLKLPSFGKAKYAFHPHGTDELDFKKGEVIAILRALDENWLQGKLNGNIGMFPITYVELFDALPVGNVPDMKLKTEEPQIIPETENLVKNGPLEINITTSDNVEKNDDTQSTPRELIQITDKTNVATPCDPKIEPGQAYARYAFKAENENELSFKKGDEIALLERIDGNWYVGECCGKVGILPVNYVKVAREPVKTENVAAKSEPEPNHLKCKDNTTLVNNHDITNSSTTNGFHGQGDRHKAIHKYVAAGDDEIELRLGDIVRVLEKCEDNWYIGTSERTGAFGIFPGNYVVPAH